MGQCWWNFFLIKIKKIHRLSGLFNINGKRRNKLIFRDRKQQITFALRDFMPYQEESNFSIDMEFNLVGAHFSLLLLYTKFVFLSFFIFHFRFVEIHHHQLPFLFSKRKA